MLIFRSIDSMPSYSLRVCGVCVCVYAVVSQFARLFIRSALLISCGGSVVWWLCGVVCALCWLSIWTQCIRLMRRNAAHKRRFVIYWVSCSTKVYNRRKSHLLVPVILWNPRNEREKSRRGRCRLGLVHKRESELEHWRANFEEWTDLINNTR